MKTRLIVILPIILFIIAYAAAEITFGSVQWWLTTLDRSQLFKRQPDLSIQEGTFTKNQKSTVFHVYDGTRLQPIYGFGGALTQSSAYLFSNLKRTNETLYWKTLRQMFAPSVEASMAVMRVPISACDFNLPDIPYYTYDDVNDDVGFEHFSLKNDMNYIIPILKDIQSLNPRIKIIGSPWSAPVRQKKFFKTTRNTNSNVYIGMDEN